VARHPSSSVFHDRGWLEALNRTYGFDPFVLTNTEAGKPLANGLVLCRVSSWITGKRLVSLPFSDHCEPLLTDASELHEFVNWLREECDRQGAKYFELRLLPRDQISDRLLVRSQMYCFHKLDLTPPLEEIFGRLHKNSIQRRIRRAGKELSCEVGRSRALVDEFYHLLTMTRRSHQVPPQPRSWFQNLVECMGQKLQISVARKNGVSIAAMLTLRHGSTVVYKYGGSDQDFHHIGGMPYLFWNLIETSKQSGATEIDFGRSELKNQGLITFKDRFGTARKLITYFRHPYAEDRTATPPWIPRSLGRVLSILPTAVMPAVGRVIYRHIC
jgi:hypothetical protein